jgi:hypothetical protein
VLTATAQQLLFREQQHSAKQRQPLPIPKQVVRQVVFGQLAQQMQVLLMPQLVVSRQAAVSTVQ